MRSDYILYLVAAVFFLITVASFALLTETQRNLSMVSTVVIGLLSLGIGYSQRPKSNPTATTPTTPMTPTTPAVPTIATPDVQPAKAETSKEEKAQTQPEPLPSLLTSQVQQASLLEAPPTLEALAQQQPTIVTSDLTKIKGIKEKRATQLKTIGISSLDDLANASANDVAAKLQISPKFVEKWITGAKELIK